MSLNITKTGILNGYNIEPFLVLEDGSIWKLLLFHSIENGTNLFTSADAGFCNKPGLFSRLNYIDNYIYDGRYEFLQQQDYGIYRRWTQTNAPLTTTAVTGFTAISNSPNNGICKCSGNTLLATSNSTGNWWHACGCWTLYQGGIPGWNSTVAKKYIVLYTRISNINAYFEDEINNGNQIIEY